MKILYLAHRVPFPPNKGDKIRSFHEIERFSRRNDVHLCAFCDGADDMAHAAELKKYCRTVTLVPLRRWTQCVRAAGSVARREPWSLGYFESPEMSKALSRTLSCGQFDLAFGYSSSVAPYLRSMNIPRVLDFVDSDAGKWQQYADFHGFPFRHLYAYEARRLAAFEDAIAREFDCSVFVSQREVRHLSDAQVREKIHFIQNGIDLEFFSPSPRDSSCHDIVFVGAMNYYPNIDGATFFAHHIFPKIRARVEDARFVIVGSQPSAAVRRLGSLPGVEVTGAVVDVRPYLARARVAVVPIRISQGIQNKILEALAVGLPVVATPIAAEGITQAEQLPLAAASQPADFAERVLKYLADPPISAEQASACRSQLRRYYDWETNLSAFDGIFENLTSSRVRASAAGHD